MTLVQSHLSEQGPRPTLPRLRPKGTPDYIAPDYVSVEDFRGDERSDIYSLGVCLFETLTGSLPYVACMVLAIVLLCLFPGIATWLPDMVMGAAR